MKKNEKGFTLVELMIVVAIIAILAAVALPAFGQQVKKSRDGKAVQMMGSMRSQLGMVQADLEGESPTAASMVNVFKESSGNLVTGTTGTVNCTTKGIQGFDRMGIIGAAGTNGTIIAGVVNRGGTVVTTVNWAYSVTDCKVGFSEASGVNDTKGKDWASY